MSLCKKQRPVSVLCGNRPAVEGCSPQLPIRREGLASVKDGAGTGRQFFVQPVEIQLTGFFNGFELTQAGIPDGAGLYGRGFGFVPADGHNAVAVGHQYVARPDHRIAHGNAR